MMTSNEAGMVLQRVYNSMSQHFELQLINSYHHLSPQNIDQLVDAEMKRLRASYQDEEERYVEKMLQENPVVVERRTAPAHPTRALVQAPAAKGGGSASVVATRGRQEGDASLSQQRAESCRKSRINNKVKKAKTKFRHKFVSHKMAQSENVLKCIRDVIAQAESQLLASGYNQTTLQKLRNVYGLQRRESSSDDDDSSLIEVD